MAWLQLQTTHGQAHPEQLEAVLEELGSLVVTLSDSGDNPVYEPAPGETPRFQQTIVTALFSADADAAAIKTALSGLIDGDEINFSTIEDRDWQADWNATLQPIRCGQQLWVIPDGLPLPETGVHVRLSPGMAFGTGEHPTTAMCLEWLDNQDLSGKTLLDYGCGSGLLAIAAIKLGAVTAKAVDIDPQALAATRSNAENNNCLSQLNVCFPEEIDDNQQYDVLVANILSGTLIELGPAIRKLVRPGAPLALTGILPDQAEQVSTAWSDWADLKISNQVGDWILLSGHKHGLVD